MARAAPACKAALAEATKLWPSRSIASDGILSSAEHRKQNANSGHDLGNAFDLTHDPAHGCDAHALAERTMKARDERVLYVISRRRIWSRARYSEGWRTYRGSNPHDAHAHFELDPAHRDSTWPWWPPATPPIPPSTPPSTVTYWWLEEAMPVFKDSVDEERAFIRTLYLKYLLRQPESFEAMEWWRLELQAKGADFVIAQFIDLGEGADILAKQRAAIGA